MIALKKIVMGDPNRLTGPGLANDFAAIFKWDGLPLTLRIENNINRPLALPEIDLFLGPGGTEFAVGEWIVRSSRDWEALKRLESTIQQIGAAAKAPAVLTITESVPATEAKDPSVADEAQATQSAAEAQEAQGADETQGASGVDEAQEASGADEAQAIQGADETQESSGVGRPAGKKTVKKAEG